MSPPSIVIHYQRHHGLGYLSVRSVDFDGITYWHLESESQTDWSCVLYHVPGIPVWHAVRSRESFDMPRETVCELWETEGEPKLLYEFFNYVEDPDDSFPEWYHDKFHSHMFLCGSCDSWSICPQNQMDWHTELEFKSGLWFVSCKKEEEEDLVEIYYGTLRLF